MGKWQELPRELEGLLRLRTSPIAFKRVEKLEDLDKIPRLRKIERNTTFCQLTTLARSYPRLAEKQQ